MKYIQRVKPQGVWSDILISIEKSIINFQDIFIDSNINEYLERPNTLFVLIYVLLLTIGRHGKFLIGKGAATRKRLGTPDLALEKKIESDIDEI